MNHLLKTRRYDGSDNPIIRKLTIKNIISSFIIIDDDVKIVKKFKTEDELVKSLEQDKYELDFYSNKEWSSHIYYHFPKEEHSDGEIKTIIRSNIITALGILRYRKSSNSIIKLMQKIISQKTASEFDLMLIRVGAKTLGTFKLKKTLNP